MNYNNLRILYCKEIHDNKDEINVVDYTYDTVYIKNYINKHDYKNDVLEQIKNFGYVRTSIKINKSYMNDYYYLIIDIDFNEIYSQYKYYLNLFKHLHRDYQLKGIINEL